MRRSTSPEILALVALDAASERPLHRQLYDGLRQAILEGLLRTRERVPATRQFATELGISRLTVLTAYEQLLHEGYLEARVGSGTFVSGSLPEDALYAAKPTTKAISGGEETDTTEPIACAVGRLVQAQTRAA